MSPKERPNGNEQQTTPANLVQRFLLGAFFSGLFVFVYLTLSLEMTHVSLMEFGRLKLAAAIAAPVLCGIASAAYGDRATKLIAATMDSVNLPF